MDQTAILIFGPRKSFVSRFSVGQTFLFKGDVIFIHGKSERANTSQVTGRPEVDFISMVINPDDV